MRVSLLLMGLIQLLAGFGLAESQLVISSPVDYQIVQRSSQGSGSLPIQGTWSRTDRAGAIVEYRLPQVAKHESWQALSVTWENTAFRGQIEIPQGGWYTLELRVRVQENTIDEGRVPHMGAGEIFIVAGQSNSANYGEERQTTQTGQVAAWHEGRWQLAKDPQPGAGGSGGSWMPPLGDAIAARLKVPVGFVACGIGATSVREWLPRGSTFPNPPTIESNVKKRPDGHWESNGAAFEMLVSRMKPFGPHGFRAVLWHQGESDANQKDPSRTLAGPLYRQSLESVIRDSGRELGWKPTWFVAQASYHVPGDEASPEIREAQASLWKDGLALPGPDTDSLKSEWRDSGGRGVHFSGPGLRKHAELWTDKLVPWLESQPTAEQKSAE